MRGPGSFARSPKRSLPPSGSKAGEKGARTFRTGVAGTSWVLTRSGFRSAADLLGGTYHVWTGSRWAEAQVTAGQCTSSIFRVNLSNGLSLTCSRRQTWAVKRKRDAPSGRAGVRAVSAGDLRPGDVLFPFNLPKDKNAVCAPPGVSRAIREKAFRLVSRTPPQALPQDVLEYAPGDLLQFVDAWAAAQDGKVYAHPEAIRQLHLLLLSAGVGPCLTASYGEDYVELLLPRCEAFRSVRRASAPGETRVSSVEKVSQRGAAYHIVLLDEDLGGKGQARSVVVEGALLLAPAAADGGERSFSGSDSDRSAVGGGGSPARSPIRSRLHETRVPIPAH